MAENSISRREALAAVIGGAIAGTVPAAVEPVAAKTNANEVDRWRGGHRYLDADGHGVNHPAIEKAVVALTLLDLSLDHAWGEYRDTPGLNCTCDGCQSSHDAMMGLEWVIQLFRDVLEGPIYGGRSEAIAKAPGFFREWLLHLAEEQEKGLRQLKADGKLSAEWDAPLAELADDAA